MRVLVYRETARQCSAAELCDALLRCAYRADAEASLEALLRAGELECGLADELGSSDPRAQAAAAWSDACAARLLGWPGANPAILPVTLSDLRLPLRVREPEGYAYYALDPRAYAGCLPRLLLDAAAVAIVGIRSIGTGLSAAVKAALEGRAKVERISVRPTGHPWDRELILSDWERAFVTRGLARSAQFVIVDEGPGLSGSTFLAVARALEHCGVPNSAITLLGSHQANAQALTARDAARRFQRYRRISPAPPVRSGRDLSAGAWRELVFGPDRRRWPARWTQAERIKQLSMDGRWLDKFAGFAPYCRAALARAQAIEAAGFGTPGQYRGEGFVRYAWLAGRPASAADLANGALDRLAKYCAFRARECCASSSDAPDIEALTRMLEVNLHEELDVELGGSGQLELQVPVVPDARMQPYKWILTTAGQYYKLDGDADGEGHLLPGPCDICWDLAGAIVEWRMDAAQRAAFLQAYERQSGDRVAGRLPNYLLAYRALAAGVYALAELSASPEELVRLRRARADNRAELQQLLAARSQAFKRSTRA